jgi:CRISPR-associated protein Cmr5
MAESTSQIKKLEQGRAKFAWDRAKKAKENNSIKFDEYKAYSKKLPMLIKTGGLGATLAFIKSKAKKKNGDNTAYGQLYDDIAAYFKQTHMAYILDLDNRELMEAVIDIDSAQYRSVTVETLALLQWLRRFADGIDK